VLRAFRLPKGIQTKGFGAEYQSRSRGWLPFAKRHSARHNRRPHYFGFDAWFVAKPSVKYVCHVVALQYRYLPDRAHGDPHAAPREWVGAPAQQYRVHAQRRSGTHQLAQVVGVVYPGQDEKAFCLQQALFAGGVGHGAAAQRPAMEGEAQERFHFKGAKGEQLRA